jgi:hypothetical protein
MAERTIVPRTTKFSFKKEAAGAFGVAPTDAASDSVLTNNPATPRGLGRNWIPNDSIIGHLGRLRPHDGGAMDDIGFDAQLQIKGSGTAGVAPECGQLLECSFGKESVGVAGTVAASPAPTTVAFTYEGASADVPVGHLADIEISTGVYRTRRILTNAAKAVTVWPPLPSAPASGANVIPGVSYLLTSTPSEMASGTGFWYFENGEKLSISGNRGNPVFNLAIRQPIAVDFAMTACVEPVHSQTPIGYVWAPPGLLIMPPMCLGVDIKVYIPAKVAAGATTTSIPLKTTGGLTSYFEATDAVANSVAPDQLIVDVGSGVWETKSIATWTDATQTATCTALGSAPAENQNAYIQRTICVNDALSFDPGHTVTRFDCMDSASGWANSQISARETRVEWSSYFRSFIDLRLQEQAAFTELWAIAGTTRGNKIAICCPNVFADTYELDMGGEFGTVTLGGGGHSNGLVGNQEMYVTFL